MPSLLILLSSLHLHKIPLVSNRISNLSKVILVVWCANVHVARIIGNSMVYLWRAINDLLVFCYLHVSILCSLGIILEIMKPTIVCVIFWSFCVDNVIFQVIQSFKKRGGSPKTFEKCFFKLFIT